MVGRRLLLLSLVSGLLASASADVLQSSDISVDEFAEEIRRWMTERTESQFFRDALDALRLTDDLQRTDWRSFIAGRDFEICIVCQSVLKTLITMRRAGLGGDAVGSRAKKICTLLNLQTEEVCNAVVDLNLPTVLYVIDSKKNLTSQTICGVLLESQYCPLNDPEYEWTVNVDSNPAKEITRNNNGNNLRILQLTDIHYDSKYEVNGNAQCREPTCCRLGQNQTNGGSLAGYWGDYNNCDTPWHAVVDALDHITTTHQGFDYVYFTGDIIDHGVWETSKEGNMESLEKIYRRINESFSVPVYPILGNHEPHPLNQFAPRSITREDLTTQWLYEFLSDLWIGYGWIPESAKATILQGGFYTVSPKKGFRVVVLNSNVCYSYNWWLLYAPRDPDGQLQWLADTLLQAEKNDELVHILTHIPAGDKNCLTTWKREYQRIVTRFSRIIRAQFNGHTHYDELQVFYDKHKTPTNVAWNGGSLTAYTKLNPNYKVYDVDAGSLMVTDSHNWMYNLNAANLQPASRPSWYKSYSFKEEYNLKDLSVQSLSGFLYRAARNDNLLNTYYEHFVKHAQPSLQLNCSSTCKRDYLCRAVTSVGNDCKSILRT